ncbi:MAG: SGNH/GDSL hydrolase family protein [Treponema sp.]|jgi:lysophospholipase L1-like esterase|nr:SGNH/GDSL hydrolase family protein [Treponema sp.]
MTGKLLLIGIASGAIILGACKSAPSVSEQEADSRLQNTLAKLRRGETISVVALGGSITTGYAAQPPGEKGWAGLVNTWLQARANESGGKVEYINAGIGGTDSAYGVMRAKDHVLAHNPDLVIVEFAINDQWIGGGSRVRKRTFEGLMRQFLDNSERAVIILSLKARDMEFPDAVSEQKNIAKHYGLNFLDWNSWVKFQEFSQSFNPNDGIHPNDYGHANIAAGITGFLEAAWNRLPPDDELLPVAAVLPPPLTSSEFQNITYISGKDGMETNLESSGWTAGPSDPPGDWLGKKYEPLIGWSTVSESAELTIRVKGKSVGILFTESDQFQNCTAWIVDPDGTKTYSKVTAKCYVSYRNGYFGHAYVEVADNLDVSKEYILHLAVGSNGKAGGKTNVIGVICSNP